MNVQYVCWFSENPTKSLAVDTVSVEGALCPSAMGKRAVLAARPRNSTIFLTKVYKDHCTSLKSTVATRPKAVSGLENLGSLRATSTATQFQAQ